MTRRLCALVIVGTIGAACDSSPVRPQPSLPPQAPVSPSLGVHLTGVVRDDRGRAVAGATVTSPQTASSVLTNEAGQFDLSFDQQRQGFTVSASKIGYEPDSQSTSGPSRDLTLHEIIRIPVGESVRVTVGPNDTYMEDEYLDGYRIRVVRVMAAEAMTVHFRLESDESGQASLFVRNAQLQYPARVNVSSALELVVEVRIPWNLAGSGRTLTLSTSRQGF
jgi:hypothetical protein